MKQYIAHHSIFLFVLIAVCCLLSNPAAAASNITVSTTDDVVADDGLCSLREAIIAANSDTAFQGCTAGSGNDTIQFDPALPAPATFILSLTGKDEDGGLTGDLDLTASVTISGTGQTNTIIDGSGIDRVLHIHPGANVSITGITIQNGNPGMLAYGGGLAIEQTGILTLEESTVSNNSAVLGGGIYNLGGLISNSSTIKTNQGGGLHNKAGGLLLNNIEVLSNFNGFGITNEQQGQLQFTGGKVSENIGGGIRNDGSTASLSNLTINGNTIGGGLNNKGTTKATLTISGSSIHNNAAASGAGLYNESNLALATIETTQISFNTATAAGGGISNYGELTLKTSTIDNNQARTGGGIDHQGVSFKAENVTISSNTATDNGGGIANQTSATLTNVTVSGNGASGAGTGGNLFNDGDSPQIIFINTIIANPGPGGNCANTVGALNSLGHNLESTNSCSFSAPGDIINTDPMLGPLQNNGGPTATHALLPGSLAIDNGDNTTCPSHDQRGVLRPVGLNCDIGSYEAGGVSPIYDVDLVPDDAKSGAAGQKVTYSLQLTNNGNVTDTFDLSIANNNWITELSDLMVTLPASGIANITATVTIPVAAPGNDSDMATITAESQGNPAVTDSATLTTRVTAVYGVSISPAQTKTGQAGQELAYTLLVTNTGNVNDSFALTVSGNNWPTILSTNNVTLEPSQSKAIMVVVDIPTDAADNMSDTAIITAVSQGDSNVDATTNLTTTSHELLYLLFPIIRAIE